LIARLDAEERVAVLSRVARGDGTVGAELLRRFRQQVPAHSATLPLRTAGTLRARAEVLAEQRRGVLLAREAKERLRREREQTAARNRRLNTLGKRQAAGWQQVEALVITKRPGDYDAAVTLLQDLCEIGERKGRRVEVIERIRALRERHAKKPSFLTRLRKAGF
jgi:nitric oxide reductase activation protein